MGLTLTLPNRLNIRKAALLLGVPMLISGCMTASTVHRATHETQVYRQARIERVEKVVITPQAKLICLFAGKIAGTSKVGPFTLTASLPASNELSFLTRRGFARVSVPPSAVAQGWHLPEGPGLLPVEVVFPVILTGYGTASVEPDQFPGLKEAERTLYVVASEKMRLNLDLVYVAQDRNPKGVVFSLQSKIETRAPSHPLLLLLPFTVAGDLATLPLQVVFFWNLGH